MAEYGTFNVSRAIWTHDAFADEPLTEREAFLWLVGEAAWKPRTRRVGKYTADMERGQLFASIRFMAGAWRWSKSRVSRFLLRLKNRDMLKTESGTVVLTITICNYDEYQSTPTSSGTEAGQSAGQKRDSSGTVAGQTLIKEEGKKKVKKEANASQKKGTRLPSDWSLPKQWGDWAIGEGLSDEAIRFEADKFADHWHSLPGQRAVKIDWLKTWRNWCRNSNTLKPQKANGHDRSSRTERLVEMAARQDARTEDETGRVHSQGADPDPPTPVLSAKYG